MIVTVVVDMVALVVVSNTVGVEPEFDTAAVVFDIEVEVDTVAVAAAADKQLEVVVGILLEVVAGKQLVVVDR